MAASGTRLGRGLGLLSPTLSEADRTNSLPRSPSTTHTGDFSPPPPPQALYFCTDLAVSNRLEVRSHGKPCGEILDRRTSGIEAAEVTMNDRDSEPHGELREGSTGASRNFKIDTSAEGPPAPRLWLSLIEVDVVGQDRPPPREGDIEKGISGSWFAAKGLPPDAMEPLPLEPLPLEPLPLEPLASGPQLWQPGTTYRGITPTSKYSGSCSVELTERDSLVGGNPAPHEEALNTQLWSGTVKLV